MVAVSRMFSPDAVDMLAVPAKVSREPWMAGSAVN